MDDPSKYIIVWTNTNEPNAIVFITNETVFMNGRYAPYLRVPNDTDTDSDRKIKAMWHNPNGRDFIMYENGEVSDVGTETKVGYLVKAGW